MRKVDPAIVELKRRNRAAGCRLSPLNARLRSVSQSSTFESRRALTKPPRNLSTSQQQLPRSDGVSSNSTMHFLETAPPGNVRATRGEVTMIKRTQSNGCVQSNRPGPPVRHVPTKPQGVLPPKTRSSVSHEKDRIPVNHPLTMLGDRGGAPATENSMQSVQKPASASTVSASRRGASFGSPRHGSIPQTVCSASDGCAFEYGETNEVASLDAYMNKATWNTGLSEHISAVLNGDRPEDPFTTELWKQAMMGETAGITGYYACIRCKVPLVAPEYQVLYSVHGLAAFSRLNRRAVEVRIGNFKTKCTALAIRSEPLQLQVHCRCCGGFLGILTRDPAQEHQQNVFVVNSCCLQLHKNAQMGFHLDGVCGSSDDDDDDDDEYKKKKKIEKKKNTTTHGVDDDDDDRKTFSHTSMEVDFDDPAIFEV